jgi:hypothetical protein
MMRLADPNGAMNPCRNSLAQPTHRASPRDLHLGQHRAAGGHRERQRAVMPRITRWPRRPLEDRLWSVEDDYLSLHRFVLTLG